MSDASYILPPKRVKKKQRRFVKKRSKGRRKVPITYIQNKERRVTTFSKRKEGLMKKGYELHKLTRCEMMIICASPTAHMYTFATEKFEPMLDDLKSCDNLCQYVSKKDGSD